VTLLESLLNAIIRLEGDALVMHVGEKPYVVTTSAAMGPYRGPLAWGQVELSTKILTAEAVFAILNQILPTEKRQELDTLGAVDHELTSPSGITEQFIVVAARGGEDVFLELRRKQPAGEAEAAPAAVEGMVPAADLAEPPAIVAEVPAESAPVAPIDATQEPPPFEVVHEEQQTSPNDAEVNALLAHSAAALESAPNLTEVHDDAAIAEPALVVEEPVVVEEQPSAVEDHPMAVAEEPLVVEEAEVAAEPEPEPARERAVIVPLARQTIKSDSSVTTTSARAEGFSVAELLSVAAARGASTVYVVAQSRPMIRADGEMVVLDIGSGAPLGDSDVNRLVLDLAPPAARDAWQRGASAEWLCDLEDAGRVRWRCLTFREHRGPGLIFRMIPPRAVSADQLGLTPEVQALCSQSEGLVLVAGPRASGKSTLMSAFIDLINRTRSDHVVTIESQIGFVHESRRSFVSQREVRGDSDAVVAAVRAALREDPDVLLIEDLRSAEIASVALEAAESGRLVFGSLPAASTVAAIDRLLELFPQDRRSQAQRSLAGALRGVVAQVLLRRARGGRVAAREVLLNTPAVAALVEEGKVVQLPLAMESGRRHGMIPLNDALAALVREGNVHVTEAYLKAFDKEGLLSALKREGVDTSFAERLA
jgi:twitching motility protein PilT